MDQLCDLFRLKDSTPIQVKSRMRDIKKDNNVCQKDNLNSLRQITANSYSNLRIGVRKEHQCQDVKYGRDGYRMVWISSL